MILDRFDELQAAISAVKELASSLYPDREITITLQMRMLCYGELAAKGRLDLCTTAEA
jgi:hypothetical protein